MLQDEEKKMNWAKLKEKEKSGKVYIVCNTFIQFVVFVFVCQPSKDEDDGGSAWGVGGVRFLSISLIFLNFVHVPSASAHCFIFFHFPWISFIAFR